MRAPREPMAVRHVDLSGLELTAVRCLLMAASVVLLVVPAQGAPLTQEPDRHLFPLLLATDHSHASGSCPEFSDLLRVTITAPDPFPQFLELRRKDVTSAEVPVYVLKADNHGGVYTERVESDDEKTAAYQNQRYGAAFLVKCTAEGRYSIAGTLYVSGQKYRVGLSYDVTLSQDVTSFYEFARVNSTIHYDDLLQDKLKDGSGVDFPDLDLPSDTPGPAAREKREAVDYYVDVVVIADYAFYRFWLEKSGGDSAAAIQQAKEYVAYIFNEVNTRYDGITNDDYQLNVVLSAVIVAQTAEDSPWTEEVKVEVGDGVYQVKAESVLSKLQLYVRDNYASLPKHDHLMLLTEYDLYSDSDDGFRFNNTAGFAYLSTMCQTDGSSVSVVEDHGGFQSETTATHEVGHSLGARHDGDGNNCSPEDRYIMAGSSQKQTPDNKANPWRFSPCSITAFETYVANLTALGLGDCLTRRESPEDVPTVTGFPGQLAGPDEQCRQIYGNESYLCRGTAFGDPEDICNSMYCRNPTLTPAQCTLKTAATATCCGYRKWCRGGQCVDAPDSTCYMSVTCPFGQRQGVVLNGQTCDQLESGNCYNANFRQVCCEMCDKQRNDTVGCEYGDRVKDCDVGYCGQQLPGSGELYDVQCCGTCGYQDTASTPSATPITLSTTLVYEVPDEVDTCRDTALVNGTETCSAFLERASLAFCCQPQVQDFCCRSCREGKNLEDPDCPYGDCAICTSLLQLNEPCNDQQRQLCCHTCFLVDQRLNPTTTTPITAVTTPIATATPITAVTTPITTTTPITAASTPTTPTGAPATTQTSTGSTATEEEEEEECKEIEGVVTCGVEGSLPGSRLVWSGVGLALWVGLELLGV